MTGRSPFSVVAIGPVERRGDVVSVLAEIGYFVTPNVRLSASGSPPTTHVGLVAPVGEDFARLLRGGMTAPVSDPAAFDTLMEALTIYLVTRPVVASEQFDMVAGRLGLQRIVTPEGERPEAPFEDIDESTIEGGRRELLAAQPTRTPTRGDITDPPTRSR